MIKRLKGLIHLSDSILCKKEILGLNFYAMIAGVEVVVSFPLYPKAVIENPLLGIGESNKLLPPENGIKWSDKIEWGYPMQYPSGHSLVSVLSIVIENEENDFEKQAERLYAGIDKWSQSFLDYIKLDTKQNIERDRNISAKTCRLDLFNGKNEYIQNNPEMHLYLNIPKTEMFASLETMEAAIQFASSGKELYLEYQMLLSSYEARKNNRNREAILDACAAIELALVNKTKVFCKSKGLSPGLLLDKYRYLGERFALVKKIGIKLINKDYKTIVVDPRNSVMHNKEINPSDITTDNLIVYVEECLKSFYTTYYNRDEQI